MVTMTKDEADAIKNSKNEDARTYSNDRVTRTAASSSPALLPRLTMQPNSETPPQHKH